MTFPSRDRQGLPSLGIAARSRPRAGDEPSAAIREIGRRAPSAVPPSPRAAASGSPRRSGPFAWLALAGLLAGCAGRDRTVDDTLRDDPLPFHVGIWLESDLPDAGPTPATGSDAAGERRFQLGSRELADELARELEASRAASLVTALSAPDLAGAIEQARRQQVDQLLALEFRTKPRYDDYDISGGWAVLEVVTWLFGGIPSWFVPTLAYSTQSTLSVRAIDTGSVRSGNGKEPPEGSAPEPAWQTELSSGSQNVSLWGRVDPLDRPLDYLVTILLPPMALGASDPRMLSDQITDSTVSDLAAALGPVLRERLLEVHVSAPLSAVFLAPEPGRTIDAASVRVTLALSSLDAGRLRALDLLVLAPSGALFQWRPTKEELGLVSDRLGSRSEDEEYIEFTVPAEIPLEPGRNVVKVRVLREDARQMTRTAVFLR